MANLTSGLGGSNGFGANQLEHADNYTELVDISSIFPSGLNFFGIQNQIYIGINGCITFTEQQQAFTYDPTTLGGDIASPMIAPFWADIDTRLTSSTSTTTPGGNSTGSNSVWYNLDAANKTITITWDDVGNVLGIDTKNNAFQLEIIAIGSAGDFNFTFRYEDINWSSDFAGGSIAKVGFTAGDGNTYFELPQSGQSNAILNLENTKFITGGNPGEITFQARSGSVLGIGTTGNNDIIKGSSTSDILAGTGGNDQIMGYAGNDYLDGGDGDDRLDGGIGDDVLTGGSGTNYIYGGDGLDTIKYSITRNNITLKKNTNGTYTATNSNFTDTINTAEFLDFSDGLCSILNAFYIREYQEEFTRLYKGLYNRLPDKDGLKYWVNDILTGNTIQNAAQAFTQLQEFQSIYGQNVNNRDFVYTLYNKILNRAPDATGLNYWINEINLTGNRGGMVVSFTDSSEYITNMQSTVDNFLSTITLDGYTLI